MEFPLNAGKVNEPPVKTAGTLADEAASPVLLPAQIVALVGVMVGAVGSGFTVIATASVDAAHTPFAVDQVSV